MTGMLILGSRVMDSTPVGGAVVGTATAVDIEVGIGGTRFFTSKALTFA